MNAKQEKMVNIIGMILIVILLGVFLIYGLNSEAEKEKARISLEKCEKKYIEELKKLEAERDYNKEYINRMLNDPEFYKMEARSKLGVAAPQEIVIRDESNK